jgi:hypothetical protein
MKFYKEVTEWAEGTCANHTYLLNDSKEKMFAYIKEGDVIINRFKAPIGFSATRRKFLVTNIPVPKDLLAMAKPIDPRAVQVKGSKMGVIYTVTPDGCDCSGYKFRGKCKHFTSLFGN